MKYENTDGMGVVTYVMMFVVMFFMIACYVGGRYQAFGDIERSGCYSYRGTTFCRQGQFMCDKIYTTSPNGDKVEFTAIINNEEVYATKTFDNVPSNKVTK